MTFAACLLLHAPKVLCAHKRTAVHLLCLCINNSLDQNATAQQLPYGSTVVLAHAAFDRPSLCILRLREKPKMDIILARSPDFDAVISQESSEAKGDRYKDEPGGVSMNLLKSLSVAMRSTCGFFSMAARDIPRQPCTSLPCSCPNVSQISATMLCMAWQTCKCCADMPSGS